MSLCIEHNVTQTHCPQCVARLLTELRVDLDRVEKERDAALEMHDEEITAANAETPRPRERLVEVTELLRALVGRCRGLGWACTDEEAFLSRAPKLSAEPCARCKWADGCQRAEDAESKLEAARDAFEKLHLHRNGVYAHYATADVDRIRALLAPSQRHGR